MELECDRVADLDLIGVAQNIAGGVGGDGVAELENLQWATFLQLQRKGLQSITFQS